ncbi:MAG TPA: pyrimidine utilization protein D [Allosphingosinicella sp.]|jgi:aminoacrylate hydrolase|nr:pyrimidine utilization protein D [Allosphingosinicella sp.]
MPHAAGPWYEWHGPEDGQVLILSPGLGGSADYWKPNLPGLSETYRVLVYDHLGTGRSDPAPPERITIEGMAEDILALMQELGVSQPYFVGHALGGLIGLELELSYFATRKLVVVNGWAKLDPHTARCFDVRMELLRNSGPEAYLRAQPIFLYPADWISEHSDELDAVATRQLTHFPPIEVIEKRVAAARAFGLLHDITGPVLVVGSADDMLVPPHCSRELADELAIGEFALMDWGGHACNVTDPDTFNRIVLEFLRS